MRPNSHHANACVVMILLLGTVIGYHAVAQRAIGPGTVVIATVRMERLFAELHLAIEARAEIERLETETSQEILHRMQAVKNMEQELAGVTASPRQRELADEITLANLKTRFWTQQTRTQMDAETMRRLQVLYRAIKVAIAELAALEGYDMVFIDDTVDELPLDREASLPVQAEILQQIKAGKILHLNPAIDITDDLITRMNNEYRVSQAGP